MNGRERVMAALQRRQPDRVPVVEWIIDPAVVRALEPSGSLMNLVERLDLDAISNGAYYATEPMEGDRYRDEWGIIYGNSPEVIGGPLDGPIHSAADLRRYVPPDPNADGRLGALPAHVARFRGQRAIAWQQREAFMTTALLAGLERFLGWMVEEPRLVHDMVGMVVEVHEALARRAVRAGAELVMLGDDYAWRIGPMMSPRHFREFFLPGLKRIVSAVHEEGAFCVKHSDGNIWPLIDMFLEAGFDGLNPLEPLAGMDLAEVKRRYGDRACLVGNIDCGYVLSQAPLSEVVETVKRAIHDAGPGGGYMVSSSNSIHSSVKPENYRVMVETAHCFGVYPLDMERLRAFHGSDPSR